MFGQAGHKKYNFTIATNAVESDAYSILGANKIAIECESFGTSLITATANVFVKVCDTSSGTFRRLKAQGVYSAASGIHDWEVPSTTGDFYAICEPVVGFNFMKVEVSNTATDGYSGAYVHVFH